MHSSSSSLLFKTSKEYFYHQLTSSLSNVFDECIPKFVEANREWLWKRKAGFLCTLCNKLIQTSSNCSENVNNFKKHLKSKGHTYLLEYASKAHNPPNNTYEIWEEYIKNKLIDLYGSYEHIPLYVKESMEYIGFSKEYLYCHLCNKYLQNSYLDSQIMKQVESHLTSQGHKYQLYESTDSYETSAELYCLNVKDRLIHLFRNKLPPFVENCIDYIDIGDDNTCDFYCHLCSKHLQTSENYDSTVFNFKKHLLSERHKNHLNMYVLQPPKTALETYFKTIYDILNMYFDNSIPYNVKRCINYFGADFPDWLYCCLCDKYMFMQKPREGVMRINDLKPHLNSRQHKQLLGNIL